ncbi:Proteophosphoglycan ppg4 [Rhodotorula toruloides]|nr:Proteophosphoglycan ppg4 [Rhodotorula toruloides]
MHWLPFLRSLCPPTRPISSPIPPQTSAAPSDSSHVALSADSTPTSIVYDPDFAHWIQEQFLSSVEAALAARGWTSEVPEDVVTSWNVALPHFYAPYTKTGVRTICTRFAALGPHIASIVAALDEVLDIQRGGTVGVDFDTVLTTKMRNIDGLAPAFYQRFELVVSITTTGEDKPAVELTLEVQPGSATRPAQLDEGGGELFTRTAAVMSRYEALSAEQLAKAGPSVYELVAKMIQGARFYRNRFFLYFNGLTFSVGAITRGVEPFDPLTTASQHLQTPASSRPPPPTHPFSVLLSPPILNGNFPTGWSENSRLPTDPPPPSLVLIILAALYPQFVNDHSLAARIRQIVTAAGTRDAGEPSSLVGRDNATLLSSKGSSSATHPPASPSLTSSPQLSASVTHVWPDKTSAILRPVNPLDLQVRLEALQHETGFDANDAPCLRFSAGSTSVIQLERLIHTSKRSFVYRGTTDGQRIVAKVGRRNWEDTVIDEATASVRAYQQKAAVPPLLGLFEGRDPVDGRRIVVTVYPDCGDAPRLWKDPTTQQRTNLLLNLVYLHQHAHLEHGDATPRNTLVDANGKTKWIDLTGARVHDSCDGADCEELSEVCSEMELWEEEDS